jgi:hypothetical protein
LEAKGLRACEVKKIWKNTGQSLNRTDEPAFSPIKMARFLTGPDNG